MEKSNHKLNKNKKSGPKWKTQTTQLPIIICLAGKEIRRITKNLKVPFGEQEILQAAESWRNYQATWSRYQNRIFCSRQIATAFLSVSQGAEYDLCGTNRRQKKGLQGFQIFLQ